MQFRAPTAAAQQNARTIEYLTKNLEDRAAGETLVEELIEELGNATEGFPDWHPILTAPERVQGQHIASLSQLQTYHGIDHTRTFVRGFVTCPYGEDAANKLVDAVDEVQGLSARRLHAPLYSDKAYPVVIVATNVSLEADGTIKSSDALVWFVRETVRNGEGYEVAETWWNMRSNILGYPHGSRSSLFVNQHAGGHMRKLLEGMNDSGMFGPIKESSLDMLSKKKRDTISETLLRAAIKAWDGKSEEREFELRDEMCKATINDTWDDNTELSIRVMIGDFDLYVSGFYYPKDDRTTFTDPTGKRKLAEKFT